MVKSIHSNRTRLSFAAIAAVAVAALAVGFERAGAQVDPGELNIGTYQPNEVFQQYHRFAQVQQELQQEQQALQQELQNADPQQQQQRIMQFQEQAQQKQEQLIEEFRQDVRQALPEIAEGADIDIVAVEVAYPTDVEPEDVTEELIAGINEGAEGVEEELPPLPGLP